MDITIEREPHLPLHEAILYKKNPDKIVQLLENTEQIDLASVDYLSTFFLKNNPEIEYLAASYKKKKHEKEGNYFFHCSPPSLQESVVNACWIELILGTKMLLGEESSQQQEIIKKLNKQLALITFLYFNEDTHKVAMISTCGTKKEVEKLLSLKKVKLLKALNRSK